MRRMLDRIEEHASKLQPRRMALGIVSAPFYALGWLVGLVVRGVWWTCAWAWAALVVGFRDGRSKAQ